MPHCWWGQREGGSSFPLSEVTEGRDSVYSTSQRPKPQDSDLSLTPSPPSTKTASLPPLPASGAWLACSVALMPPSPLPWPQLLSPPFQVWLPHGCAQRCLRQAQVEGMASVAVTRRHPCPPPRDMRWAPAVCTHCV